MNKLLVGILLPILIGATGLVFVMTLSPSGSGHAAPISSPAARTTPSLASSRQLTAPNQPATPTPEPQAVSHPGSTDGIMIMSVVIIVIILVPILLQRGLWTR